MNDFREVELKVQIAGNELALQDLHKLVRSIVS